MHKMPRYIFMNFFHTPVAAETPTFSRIRAAMLAISLAVTGCISPQQAPRSAPTNNALWNELTDNVDIDDPIFIALVWLSAELQAWMEWDPKSRSLQYIWETVTKRMQEMNVKESQVSVCLCPPQLTKRGFAYIRINAAGQEMQIFAKNQKTANERTREAQEFCIKYIRDRVKGSLGWNPATQEKLSQILINERGVFAKHRMMAEIVQDKSNSWTISFSAQN